MIRLGRLVLQAQHARVQRLDFDDAVSVGVRILNPGDPAEKRLRRELLALQGQTIPVVWDNDESWAGWYTVERVQVSPVRLAFSEGVVVFDCTLGLAPVADARVDHESLFVGATIGNDYGLEGVQWDAPPAGVTSYFSQGTVPTSSTRASEDGEVTIWEGVGEHSLWYAAPSDWYAGAARISQDGFVVVGEDIDDDVTDWQLSNGIVRVSAGLVVEAWVSDEWVGRGFEVPGVTWTRLAVLRNTPEVCAVRLVAEGAPGRTVLDLTLRRGAKHVDAFLRSDTVATLGFQRSEAEAATTITAGIQADDPGEDDVRYFVFSPRTFTADLVQGGIEREADSLTFAFGLSDADDILDVRAQWLGYVDEVVRPVRR